MQSSKLNILYRYQQKFAEKDSGNVCTNVYEDVSGPVSTLVYIRLASFSVWANMGGFKYITFC